MKYPPPPTTEVLDIIQTYQLLSIGLTYRDLQVIPFEKAEALLMLHGEIKSYENDMTKQMKNKR